MDASDLTLPPAPHEPPPPPSEGKRQFVFSKLLGDVADQEVELIEVLKVLRRRKNIIFTCMAMVTAVATAVVFQIVPRYTAQSEVMIEARKTQVVDLQAVLSGLPADTAVIRSEVEVLKSPVIAEQVVRKLDLTAVPEFNLRLQKPSVLSRIQDFAESVVGRITPFLGMGGRQGPTIADDRELAAARILMRRTDIVNDGRSYVLKIRVESESPQLATSLANAYAEAYLQGQLEAKFEAVRRANTWLNEHLTDLREKVEVTDRAVQVFKAQHNLMESKGETVTVQQLSELNTQLVIAGADLAQKESNLRQIQDQLRSGGVAAAAQVLASPLIQRLREQETDLLQQEAQLAAKYKPAHPAMINIKAQERDLLQKIEDEINKIVRGMAGEVAAARAKEASLRESLRQLEKSTALQGETQVQLRQLEREAESNRTLYENFLNRFKQTSAQEDIQQADARLMSPARAPTIPSYPQKTLLIALSFGGSIWIGILAAFAAERLDHGFRTSDQFERLARIPVLGLVPDEDTGQPPIDTIVRQPICPYSEAIRTIRTALRYSRVDDPPKVVMVTSSLPAEGKSVFSVSLARSVARSGGRALVIDCDLRRPSLAKLLKVDPKPGILALFEEGTSLDAVICVEEFSGMHYIPSTAGTPNPQDLLGSKHMASLINSLRSQYDLIVLDTPPILAVSDALILSHLVDTALFLVRWGKTPRPVVLGAFKSFQANGANLAGAVLTRVNFRRHATYGYGDVGYYYGHYGKHYATYGRELKKS